MHGREAAQARHRLAEEIEDLLRAEEYQDVFEVAWALVDAIETAALGLIATKAIEPGTVHDPHGGGRRAPVDLSPLRAMPSGHCCRPLPGARSCASP